ncbi:heparinase II/III domain-containing protein [Motilibacter deserti]|uniref:Heparinase II/III-like C-terminal domain-containing protein n=1 Tax=Motilibacter deserti TaxID=2714956 RepID=A0ABX0GVW2_9ACTN|nr:heparinase II/III family protein [Motilibacter deserti]NHC14271.1 hypothetical protein [Motilibacter deserti]
MAEAKRSEATRAEATRAASASGCAAPAAHPVPDGVPISVTLPPAPPFTVGSVPRSWWRRPPVSDLSWQLTFRGLAWMQPLAARAAADGQAASLAALVAQAVALHRNNPDPGTSTDGWDEGTALRRLETLNCLYALTRDERLRPAMAACVAVQFGPRYYGPPRTRVHNHGLLANLRVARAGQLLARRDWRDRALARIRAEAPLAWTARGTTWEQATAYQLANLDLWTEAAEVLEADDPGDATARLIRTLTARARGVARWMTEPDGHLVQIGDSGRDRGLTHPQGTMRLFRDDEAGFVIGRWSWSDPATTYYTLRYGPPLRAHGHQDRGGVTWSTAGVRVVVDPGYYAYDPESRFFDYQEAPEAHNVSRPATGALAVDKHVRLVSVKAQSTAHAFKISDSLFGRSHTRTVNVNSRTRTLRVADTYAGKGQQLQFWHLHEAWTLTRRSPGRLVFRHPAGRTLTLTTTGAVSAVRRGSSAPVAGWVFPHRHDSEPASQVTLRATGSVLRTTLTVR